MNKLLVSIVLVFVGFTMISSFMEGAGGIVATYLTDNISETLGTLPVASTSGFLDEDYVTIGDEYISYTGTTPTTFTGCTRGYDGTDATVHSENRKVYSSETNILNSALGFNIATTAATAGPFSVVVVPYKFFTISMPRMIMFDYSFFTGQMVYVQVFFQAIGVAFALTMAFWVASVAWGILTP